MNIGQLLRSVMGDMKVSDAKTLELKVGQVVRGVILQLMSEQDALVNINGMQVRARLETPMAQGQTTLLQVQPETVAGQVVLKPLESSNVQIAERSLPEMLKDFGMKDTPGNRRALQELHTGQAPLLKETARSYAGVTAQIPEGIQEGQWREAAMLGVKRGLPLTTETVGALHRILFGKPLDQSLRSFGVMAAETLESGAAPLPAPVRQLLEQVRQLVDRLPRLPQPADAAAAPADARGVSGGSAAEPDAAAKAAGRGVAAQPNAAEAGAAARGGAQPQAGAAERAVAPADARGASGGGAAEPGAAAKAAGRGVAAQPSTAEAGAAARGGAQPPATGKAGEAPPSRAQGQQEPDPWIGRLLKALGVEHEQRLARPGATADAAELRQQPRISGGHDGPPPAAVDAARPAAEAAEQLKTADTLKGLLLQLSAADYAPSAIREGAQQLAQQITGQQLLLTPDRASMFSHMTWMLPIFNENGSQTAAIHIQSRKGQRGELDPGNCRLVFDLNMRTLGHTLVDVQVMDKIVSLRIHNDFQVLGELLEERRDEIKAGLEKIGYQFLSMKVLPYPEPASGGARAADQAAAALPASFAADRYHAKPYRGVDLRV